MAVNPNQVQVVEKEISLPYLVSSFDMNVVITSIGVNACVIVNTYDKEGRRLYDKNILIEGAEYANWGTDDNYLKSLIANKLGLVIKPVPIAVRDNIQISFDELPQ